AGTVRGRALLTHVWLRRVCFLFKQQATYEIADVFLHVVRETDAGAIVSGAKMLATGSALTNATFVAQNSATTLQEGKAEDYALVFIAPMDTPGTKLLCRPSYEQSARSPSA